MRSQQGIVPVGGCRFSFVRQVTCLRERAVMLASLRQVHGPYPLSQISPGGMVCDTESYITYVDTKCLYIQVILSHAAVTKYQRPAGLNNRSLFSYSFGAWDPEISVGSMVGFRGSGCLLAVSSRGRETGEKRRERGEGKGGTETGWSTWHVSSLVSS